MKKSLEFRILLELNRSLGNIDRIIDNIPLSEDELKGEYQAKKEIKNLIAEISKKYV